jgi:hypothetical protein
MKDLNSQHMLETLQMAYLNVLDDIQHAIGQTRQEQEDTNTRLTKDQQRELGKRLLTYWMDYDKMVVSNKKWHKNDPDELVRLMEELR